MRRRRRYARRRRLQKKIWAFGVRRKRTTNKGNVPTPSSVVEYFITAYSRDKG